ncbi:MAG: proline reductase-associated electron transfer protein PrdC [Bacillota bacterium]
MNFKIPLKQHIGSLSKVVVNENFRVKRGQLIAEADGLGANIHTGVSGKVKKITKTEVIIESSKKDVKDDFLKLNKSDDYLEMIKEAGIVGAGGAGFPTHVKLDCELNNGFVIANCVECEPILNHNISLIEKDPTSIIKGIKYVMEITGAEEAYIAIKAKNKKAVKVLEEKTLAENNIKIKKLRDIYPMGEERAIIKEIFGKWLEPDQLPLEANTVVLNTETIFNITEAIEKRKPVIDKDITIAGKLNGEERRIVKLRVPIGTPIKSLIEKAGDIREEYGELIIGGPYTGKAVSLEKAVLTKVDGGALITLPFPEYNGPLGLLVCACGADEARLRDIAEKMGAEVVGVEQCKNVVENNGNLKCKTPGECPGQVEKIMKLKKAGAERVLIANCSDCSNTVMCCAPKLGIPVYHHTDHIFRTLNYPLTRRLKLDA